MKHICQAEPERGADAPPRRSSFFARALRSAISEREARNSARKTLRRPCKARYSGLLVLSKLVGALACVCDEFLHLSLLLGQRRHFWV